jgi:hypothetical protein
MQKEKIIILAVLALSLALLILSACKSTPVVVEGPRPTKNAWYEHALKEVKASKLMSVTPVDAKEFCPNGMSATNWVNLLMAMAKYESNYNPNATYKENFKNSKGEDVISTGLFQLSYESVAGYGFRTTTEGLKNPELNITIAVKILERWVVQDKRISGEPNGPYRGAQRYWAVFRGDKLKKTKETLRPWCE